MARTRSIHYDAVRRQILARSAARFAAEGFARTTIGDLVAFCGISRGALYHYFQSKQEILCAILEAHVGELLVSLEAVAADGGGDPAARLHRLIATSLALYAGFRNEQIVLLNDLKHLDGAEQARIKALEVRIVDLFAVAIDALGPQAAQRPARKVDAMLLLGMINYTYTWYDPEGAVKPAELATRAAAIFLRGAVPFRDPAPQSPGAAGGR